MKETRTEFASVGPGSGGSGWGASSPLITAPDIQVLKTQASLRVMQPTQRKNPRTRCLGPGVESQLCPGHLGRSLSFFPAGFPVCESSVWLLDLPPPAVVRIGRTVGGVLGNVILVLSSLRGGGI